MKIKVSKRDIIWSYIGVMFSIGSAFLKLPFILFFLTADELGLWYIFLAISGIVRLFDFGFTPTFARNIAYCWSGAEKLTKEGCVYGESKKVNYRLLKTVISTCKVQYGIISIAALLLSSTLGTWYVFHVSNGLSGNDHLIAWGIFCVAIFLNLYYGYFAALLRGVGAVSKINQAMVFSNVIQIVFSILLLYLGFGLIASAIGFLINGLLLGLLCRKYFLKYENLSNKLTQIKEKTTKKEIIELYKIMSFNAYRDGLVSFSHFLGSQATTIISSLFLSLTETAIYSLSLQLINIISSVSSALIMASHPALQSAYINQDKITQRKLVAKGISLFYILYSIGVIAVILIGFPLIQLLGLDMAYNIPIFLGLSLYTFLWTQQVLFAAFISNTNRILYMKSFLVSSVFGTIASLLLMGYFGMGLWGLIIGPGVIQLAYNNWKWVHFFTRELDITLFELLRNGIADWKSDVFLRVKHVKK